MAQQTCVDCHKASPLTESGQTLIGSRHGWRLVHVATPTGRIAELRCPDCWKRFKELRNERT
jgi:hypothetical protein